MLVGENNHGTNQRRLNHSRRVVDHVYWNWITGTPMHIHLDGIQRIRVIEDKHHQREENN